MNIPDETSAVIVQQICTTKEWASLVSLSTFQGRSLAVSKKTAFSPKNFTPRLSDTKIDSTGVEVIGVYFAVCRYCCAGQLQVGFIHSGHKKAKESARKCKDVTPHPREIPLNVWLKRSALNTGHLKLMYRLLSRSMKHQVQGSLP